MVGYLFILLGHGRGAVGISFVRTRVAIRIPGLDPGFAMRKRKSPPHLISTS